MAEMGNCTPSLLTFSRHLGQSLSFEVVALAENWGLWWDRWFGSHCAQHDGSLGPQGESHELELTLKRVRGCQP
jgi:hypothetical protein